MSVTFRFICLFLIFLSSTHSLGAPSCAKIFEKEVELYQNLNEITHPQVEIFNKNNNFGLQFRGDLKFKLWSELSYREVEKSPMYSVIGLTEAGTLYHLVGIGKRKLARKLSGHEVIEGFRLTNKGRLLAWNNKGQTLYYAEPLWLTPLGKLLARRFMKAWGVTSVGAVTLTKVMQAYLWDKGMDISVPIETFMGVFNLPVFEGIVVFASGMSAGFAQLFRFENLNTNPNGFTVVSVPKSGREWMRLDLDPMNLQNFTTPKPEFLPPEMKAEITESFSE